MFPSRLAIWFPLIPGCILRANWEAARDPSVCRVKTRDGPNGDVFLGFEQLMCVPIELPMINENMLTGVERAWLKAIIKLSWLEDRAQTTSTQGHERIKSCFCFHTNHTTHMLHKDEGGDDAVYSTTSKSIKRTRGTDICKDRGGTQHEEERGRWKTPEKTV
ncbi:hypothetical protein K443DRAFT_125610 [Laccaria amethystina LaAM-08-1]|uniref:Peptidase M24 C-terminal domain-containing protein n=1 Tax=Laccaria amethystina LaAM-08-1 TaxID=1095629 RepID=A0A0C9WQG5_9AGAR|nr:hypothetical protein K443DRAFT_125610 [Laccaria amethystina LaAM-08-1]